jgi:hypothetical protein
MTRHLCLGMGADHPSFDLVAWDCRGQPDPRSEKREARSEECPANLLRCTGSCRLIADLPLSKQGRRSDPARNLPPSGKERSWIMTTEGQTTDLNAIEKFLCGRSRRFDVGTCADSPYAPPRRSQRCATMAIPWHAGASAMWLGARTLPETGAVQKPAAPGRARGAQGQANLLCF